MLAMVKIAHAEVAIEYGVTTAVQDVFIDPSGVDTYVIGSVDLVVDADIGSGNLHMFIEGASSAAGSVSDVVDGVNADAGTAADASGAGRLQLSEIAYAMGFGGYSISVGVQNLFAFMDANSSANTETDQFMAGSLVNNPTISAPGYTVSAVLNYGYENQPNGTVMIANAYGLGDNASAGYGDLFDFGQTAEGLNKGYFALAEARIEDKEVWMSLGLWTNTQEGSELSGGYISLDSAYRETFAWSTRFGWNDSVDIATFASASTAFAYGDDVWGVGLAWHGLASKAGGEGNPVLAEAYYRWQISDTLSLTPDLQVWVNANGLTEASAGVVGGVATVYGLRLQYSGGSSY